MVQDLTSAVTPEREPVTVSETTYVPIPTAGGEETVIFGLEVYPEPAFVNNTSDTLPLKILEIAVAVVPPPTGASIVIVGAS